MSKQTLPRRRAMLSLLAVVLLLAIVGAGIAAYVHSQDKIFSSYAVGFSTPETKVWVSGSYLNGRIAVLGGSVVSTCGDASKTNRIFNRPMPHEIYVNWEEEATKKRYEAAVKLVADLAQRARNLPGITVTTTGHKKHGDPYLIIGLALNGKVTVWLTNYPYKKYITGRVLEVIGQAQGTLTKTVAPLYPRPRPTHQ